MEHNLSRRDLMRAVGVSGLALARQYSVAPSSPGAAGGTVGHPARRPCRGREHLACDRRRRQGDPAATRVAGAAPDRGPRRRRRPGRRGRGVGRQADRRGGHARRAVRAFRRSVDRRTGARRGRHARQKEPTGHAGDRRGDHAAGRQAGPRQRSTAGRALIRPSTPKRSSTSWSRCSRKPA